MCCGTGNRFLSTVVMVHGAPVPLAKMADWEPAETVPPLQISTGGYGPSPTDGFGFAAGFDFGFVFGLDFALSFVLAFGFAFELGFAFDFDFAFAFFFAIVVSSEILRETLGTANK